jgi:hypothetical protein
VFSAPSTGPSKPYCRRSPKLGPTLKKIICKGR